MKKGSFFKTQNFLPLFILITGLVTIDQISKYLIEANLNLYESVKIFILLDFTFIKNFGGAPTTRMQAAQAAIKSLVTDSSLTAGVNFGFA